jgi:acetyl esterase/lipase
MIGDSSGGGMALAVALQLRDRGLSPPARTVLVSPWLDLTLSDPAVESIAPHDPLLAAPGLRAVGDLYRGDLRADNSMVSPINGNLTGLGPITMISGTRDILNADAHRLVTLAKQAGLSLDFHEAPDMLHGYPTLPIPEAKQARTIIASTLIA